MQQAFFPRSQQRGLQHACESANVGDVGTINGVEYTVVSELNLRQRIINNADISSVCTSRITDMEKFFYQNDVFSQDISTWDVSNVISMSQMFEESAFNLDISNYYEKLETSSTASLYKRRQEGDYLENLFSYGLTLNKLDGFMEGEIFDEMIDNLSLQAQKEELKKIS